MRTPICIITLIIIQILLISYSLDFDFGYVVDGGDTQLLLKPQLFVRKSFFVWEDTITGTALFTPGSWLPYAFLLSAFDFAFKSMALRSFAYYVTLFSLSSVSMFLLSRKLLGEMENARDFGISFFLGIFYSLNLYSAIVFHTPVGHTLYLFGITPLLILLFTEIEVSSSLRGKVTWILVYSLLFWPLTRMLNMFVVYLVMVPFIGFVINYGVKIPVTKFCKYCAAVSIVVCLVASPVLFMLPFGEKMPVTEIYTKSAAEIELGNRVVDSIRFIRTFALECSSNESVAGILSYSFLSEYQRNPLLVIITFYPVLMIISLFLYSYPTLDKREKSRILGLLLMAMLAIVLITPSLTPLGELLYNNKIYVFRSAWKYFSVPYILCLSITLLLLLKHLIAKLQKREFTILLTALLLIHSAYIIPAICVYGRSINQAWIVKVPEEYYDLAEFLQEDPENYRILPLPITNHFAGYVPYRWRYVGPDVLYTMVDKALIDKHHNVIAPQEYLDIVEKIEDATPTELIELCQILNVKYILLRKDVDTSHPYITLNHSPEYYEEFLDHSESIGTKYSFGNLTLYTLRQYMPRIFALQSSTAQTSKDLSEIFNETAYKQQNITYLEFNCTPITIENHIENIQNLTLNITFKLFSKNTESEEWQAMNHAIIQTELFKISVSPKGWLYTFLYFENKTFLSAVTPFQRMQKTSLLEINFQDNNFSIYLDKVRIHQNEINGAQLANSVQKTHIGSNFGNTELLVGNIYSLNFTVNGEERIDTKTLLSSYPNYTRHEEIPELNLNLTKIEWEKTSPTHYQIRINNSAYTQNGYFLTFLTTHHTGWKAYITKNGKTSQIQEAQHLKTFEYANAWYVNQTGMAEINIKYEPQKWFHRGSVISLTTLIICSLYITYSYTRSRNLLSKIKSLPYSLGFKEP